MIALIIFLSMLALIVIGMPIALAMLISGCLGLFIYGGMSTMLGILSSGPHDIAVTYEFLTIPMFLLMAEFVLRSGAADDLFKAASAWVGRVPGGLGIATAMAGAGFGAICGSSTAAAATLSATSLPAMKAAGYDDRVAAGVVAISGTLSMLIPPSIAMVVYGLLTDVSIAKMLVAGFVPGIIIAVTIALTTFGIAIFWPSHAPSGQAVPFKEKIRLLKLTLPMVALMLFVGICLYTGLTTPTETSAIAALAAAVLYFVRGNPTKAELFSLLGRAAMTTSMLGLIFVGAHVFATAISLTQVAQDLVSWITTVGLAPGTIILLILLIYIILGCFMDQMAILVLTVPIVAPIVSTLGFDLIWFGVLVIVVAELGMVTPPLGLNCFVVARYAGIPSATVFSGVVPHIITHIIAVLLMFFLPDLVMWLPNQL